jgi:hypothetical protein
VEADFFAGNEAQINWSQMPYPGRLPELFRTEKALQTIAGYNTHTKALANSNAVERSNLLLVPWPPRWLIPESMSLS